MNKLVISNVFVTYKLVDNLRNQSATNLVPKIIYKFVTCKNIATRQFILCTLNSTMYVSAAIQGQTEPIYSHLSNGLFRNVEALWLGTMGIMVGVINLEPQMSVMHVTKMVASKNENENLSEKCFVHD